MILIIFFLLGVAIGSFLNVVILRHQKEEAITGRSGCMTCGKRLAWFELIPIFSFIIQGGKCRGCNTKLSLQYPLVELGTGILFVSVFFQFFPSVTYTYLHLFSFMLHLAIWSLLMVITVYDFQTKLIPDEFSYTLAFFAFLTLFIGETGFVVPNVWHALAGPLFFLPFYALWSVSDGRWLGLGDGKLVIGIGWLLGLSYGVTAILFAFWIGAGFAVLLIAVQKLMPHFGKHTSLHMKELTFKSEIPFGPFLVLGTCIVYFWNVNIYTHLLYY